MTGEGNKPHYVCAPYPSTLFPYQYTKGKGADTERPTRGDNLDSYEPIKDIDLPPSWTPIKASFQDREF
jgi:hypothetical protein